MLQPDKNELVKEVNTELVIQWLDDGCMFWVRSRQSTRRHTYDAQQWVMARYTLHFHGEWMVTHGAGLSTSSPPAPHTDTTLICRRFLFKHTLPVRDESRVVCDRYRLLGFSHSLATVTSTLSCPALSLQRWSPIVRILTHKYQRHFDTYCTVNSVSSVVNISGQTVSIWEVQTLYLLWYPWAKRIFYVPVPVKHKELSPSELHQNSFRKLTLSYKNENTT